MYVMEKTVREDLLEILVPGQEKEIFKTKL